MLKVILFIFKVLLAGQLREEVPRSCGYTLQRSSETVRQSGRHV